MEVVGVTVTCGPDPGVSVSPVSGLAPSTWTWTTLTTLLPWEPVTSLLSWPLYCVVKTLSPTSTLILGIQGPLNSFLLFN